jgi:hypothetical protein
MRRLFAAALVFPRAERRAPDCIFQVFISRRTRATAGLAQPIRSITDARFSSRDPVAERRDVQRFYPYRAADGSGSYGALLELDDHGRTVLDGLSVEHRGSYLYVFINGRPLTEFQVDRRVSDGKIYLASGLSEADIKSMARDWKLIGGRKKK